MYKVLKYFGCFGTYTELPSSSPLYDYKTELLNISKKVSENNVDKQRLEVNVLHILQKMILQLKIYDINNVIREFKQLQIQNIWLYAIPKSNPNTLLLLPNSNFGKRNLLCVFIGNKSEFLHRIDYDVSGNLNRLSDAGFLSPIEK